MLQPPRQENESPYPSVRPRQNYVTARTAGGPFETVDDDTREPAAGVTYPYERTDHPAPRFHLKLSPPRLTYFFIALNLAAFVLMIWVGWSRYGILNGFESIDVLVLLGAKVNQLIVLGEWWRLFTAMFLHVGILHLLFNVYAIFAIGPMVEGYYGSLRFAIIYLLGGLTGSLASFAFSPSISAGASGAVFALAAAVAVYFFRYRENFGARGRAILQNMVVVLGANLVFGLVSQGIDNWGHVGGMVGGLLLGTALLPRYAAPTVIGPTGNVAIPTRPAPLRIAAVVLVASALLWMGVRAAAWHWVCGSWLGC